MGGNRNGKGEMQTERWVLWVRYGWIRWVLCAKTVRVGSIS